MSVRSAAFARAVLTAVLFAPATVASAQTFHSTANGAVGSIDPYWTVAANTRPGEYNAGLSAFGGTFGDAYRWDINYDDWFGPRPGTVTPSMISNNAVASNGGIGNYTYFIFRQSFDLTGYDPATANLQFRWACDDDNVYRQAVGWTPQFTLNGGALQGTDTCGSYALGDVVTLTTGFVNGVNVMDFYVQGNGLFDGFGLKTESFTATSVPEPSTALLLGAGLLGVGLVARRRQRVA